MQGSMQETQSKNEQRKKEKSEKDSKSSKRGTNAHPAVAHRPIPVNVGVQQRQPMTWQRMLHDGD